MSEQERKQVIQNYLRKKFEVYYANKTNKLLPTIQDVLDVELWNELISGAFEREMKKDKMKTVIVKLEAMNDEELMSWVLSSGKKDE